MKILYAATDQDLSSFHGGTIHVRAVASELRKYGHEIHLVIQRSLTLRSVPGGCTVHEIPRTSRYLLWKTGAQIQSLLEELRPDVVMERYYNFAGEAMLRANRMATPTLLEVNSPMIEYPGSLKSKIDFLLGGALSKRRNRIAEAASLILSPMPEIVPSEYRKKVRHIEWGADTTLFDPASLLDCSALRSQLELNKDEIIFIHFGSLRKWHGLAKLLEAFDAARNQFQKPAHLIVIGPLTNGPQRKDVQFTGMIPHEKLPAWLKASDVAVFPFDTKQHKYLELGFYWSPLKLFEAMSMQIPIVTLKQDRLVSLLGTDDPDFYYDGTMENLSAKMVAASKSLLTLKEKAKSFRETVVNNYSWEQHGKKLNQLLSELEK
jgi:glycosyltransferase involved in cell wall biosynthesis